MSSVKWRKIIGIAIGTAALFVMLIAGAVLALHNYSVRQYLLRIAQQKISEAIGVPVDVRDFSLHLSGIDPSVDMYGVAIGSAGPYAGTPLLQADHLAVGLRIVSIAHQEWRLSDVRIDHPVARIFIDAKGGNNLPQLKSDNAGSSPQTNIFGLGIRHVILDRGEVYYNDRKSAVDADLHDLNFKSVFDPAAKQYSGTLGYHDGNIRAAGFNPFIHSLEVQFEANPSGANLKHIVLTSGSSKAVLSATVQNYAQPNIQAHYELTLNTGELRQLVKMDTVPAGIIQLTGEANYAAIPNKLPLQTVHVDGNISSKFLHVELHSLKTNVSDFSASYQLHDGNVEVRGVRAGVLGGEITGSLAVGDIAGSAQSHVEANARNVSLSALRTLAGSPGTAQVHLAGTLNAKIEANWTKTLETLVARADATAQADAAPVAPQTVRNVPAVTPGVVPVNGAIHAQYHAANQQISFEQSELRTPQTTLTLNGTAGKTSALQVRFESRDLHELEIIADEFGFAPPGQPPLGLGGNASFTGSVSGATANPQIAGELAANTLQIRGTSWQTLRTRVTASPSHIALADGNLRPVQRGNITFNIGIDLDHWAFSKTNPLQIDLNASQLSIEDLTKLANVQAPVSGTLSVNMSLRGSELSPTGQGTLNLTQASISGEPIQSVNVNFQGAPDEVHGRLTLQMPAGTAQATLTYFPKRQGYEAQLSADGIRLDRLQTLEAGNAQIAGMLNLNASGNGTFQDPHLQLTLQVPQLKLRDQAINDVSVEANVANHVATVSLDSRMLNTTLKGSGTVKLSGDYYAEAKLDTMAIPLEPLIAIYAPSQAGNMTGDTEVHGTLRGPLKQPAAIDAHITVPKLSLNYKNVVQVVADPIEADYTNRVLTVKKTALHGTGTDLQIEGTIPMAGTAPISLLLIGTMDLRLAQLMDPDVISSGQIRFDINSIGHQNVQGQIQIVNANLAMAGAPVGAENANGTLRLTNDRLEIQNFHTSVGGGTLDATGSVLYKPSIQFNLTVNGKDIRTLYPDGVREALSSNLVLTGTMDSATLRGRVHLDQVSFTPDFDFAGLIGQFSGGSTPPAAGFAKNLQLNIVVQSTNDMNLVSSKLSLQGTANLRVQGTAAEPVILGRVDLASGDLIFMGNRYVLQPSTLDFVNPMQLQPTVNVAVDTTINQYNLHMRFRGAIDHLRTDYSSDPSLPPADIINLLVFGKTTEASAANPTPGNLGAESLIASSVSGRVTGGVEKVLGISQLSVDPVLGGNQQNPGARVTIQQRVTSNLFVTFATDVTGTQDEVVKVEYQVKPRVSLSAVRDENGGFALDMRFHKIW